jgi:hypothetical protein
MPTNGTSPQQNASDESPKAFASTVEALATSPSSVLPQAVVRTAASRVLKPIFTRAQLNVPMRHLLSRETSLFCPVYAFLALHFRIWVWGRVQWKGIILL